MKHYEHISKGFEITTEDGYAVADSYNGSIVFFTEHIIDPETDEEAGTQDLYLTLNEVTRYMKESDMRNHNLVWDDEEEE